MVHIILLILKILGFLLLGIIGLVFLALIIILISPAVYRLEASGKDTLESMKGNLKFHWLFRLVSGEICFEDSVFSWRVRAGCKQFGSDRAANDFGTAKVSEVNRSERRHEACLEQEKKTHTDQGTGQNTESLKKRVPEIAPAEKKKESLYERLKKFWEKIKYTFQKFCDNIRSLGKKKDRLTAFIQNEVHKNAFFKVVGELRRLFKTMRPSDADIRIEFGFTDPAVTGYVLALISLIYPFIGGYTEILPDFEHKILRGRIYVKGRIRVLHAVVFALRLLMDENVRGTYRNIRKFKL